MANPGRSRASPRVLEPYHALRLEVLLLSRLGAAADRLLLVITLYTGAPEPQEISWEDHVLPFIGVA